jgi:hypothetical protein
MALENCGFFPGLSFFWGRTETKPRRKRCFIMVHLLAVSFEIVGAWTVLSFCFGGMLAYRWRVPAHLAV